MDRTEVADRLAKSLLNANYKVDPDVVVQIDKALLEKVWTDLYEGVNPRVPFGAGDEIEDVLRKAIDEKDLAINNGIAGLRDILFNGRARVSDPVKVDYL